MMVYLLRQEFTVANDVSLYSRNIIYSDSHNILHIFGYFFFSFFFFFETEFLSNYGASPEALSVDQRALSS